MPTLPHSVPKKVEEKVMLMLDAEDPMLKENNFGDAGMNGELNFVPSVPGLDPERRYTESIIFCPIPTYLFLCPLFHYPSFGIDCNDLTPSFASYTL